MNVLANAKKGWRQRRVSELIEAGDIRPCRGIDWELVADSCVGSVVLGKRDTPTGEIEIVMTPRKRLHTKAQTEPNEKTNRHTTS